MVTRRCFVPQGAACPTYAVALKGPNNLQVVCFALSGLQTLVGPFLQGVCVPCFETPLSPGLVCLGAFGASNPCSFSKSSPLTHEESRLVTASIDSALV